MIFSSIFVERFYIFTVDVQHKLYDTSNIFSNQIFPKDFMQQNELNEIFLFSLHIPMRLYVRKNPYNIKKWEINNDTCPPSRTSICKTIYQRDIISVNRWYPCHFLCFPNWHVCFCKTNCIFAIKLHCKMWKFLSL